MKQIILAVVTVFSLTACGVVGGIAPNDTLAPIDNGDTNEL